MKLSWKSHVRNIIQKISQSLNIIKSLRGTWWGGHPFILLVIYKATIRSVIDYGSIALSISNKNRMIKLNRVQFKTLRLVMGMRVSTPTNILLAEAGELPIKQRIHMLAQNYIIKT